MDYATLRTNPDWVVPRNRLLHRVSTVGTGLCGGIVSVHRDERLTLLLQLVSEAFPEHSKTCVHYIAELHGLRYFIKGIRSHTYGVPLVGYPAGFLMDEVEPLIGNVLVEQTIFLNLLLIVLGAGLHV